MKSRFDFINQILIEELYDKRLPALTSFREGLDSFGLVKLMQINPDTWKPFFVAKTGIRDEPLTAKKFLSLIHSEPKNDDEERAYTHFSHFLDIQENRSGTKSFNVIYCENQLFNSYQSFRSVK